MLGCTQTISEVTTNKKVAEDCRNLTINDAAKCMVNFVRGFYKYRENEDNNELTFNQIVELGGDCKDYTNLYVEIATELGYNASSHAFRFKTVNNTPYKHAYAILYDDTGYCIIDQKYYSCLNFKNGTI